MGLEQSKMSSMLLYVALKIIVCNFENTFAKDDWNKTADVNLKSLALVENHFRWVRYPSNMRYAPVNTLKNTDFVSLKILSLIMAKIM